MTNLKLWLDTVCLNFSIKFQYSVLSLLAKRELLHFTLRCFLVSLVQEAALEVCGSSSTLFFTSIVFTAATMSEVCWCHSAAR